MQSYWGFTTFDVAFNSNCANEPYDAKKVEAALSRMSAEGYNVVRVNISSPEAGDPEGGVWDLYTENVADFLRRAKAHGIYVIPVTIGVPFLGGYQIPISDRDHFGRHVNSIQDNSLILSPEGVKAKKRYLRDLIAGLRAVGAPLDSVLAFDIGNELHYDLSKVPFSLSSGSVTTANGSTYDLADPESVERMKDESLVYFVDQVSSVVRAQIPAVLVEASVWPQFWEPSDSDPRESRPRALIADPEDGGSSLDLVDVHFYDFMNKSIEALTDDLGILLTETRKPLIVGEYGATDPTTPFADAPAWLKGWLHDLCTAGYKGYVLFTWDTDTLLAGMIFWSALSGAGEIDDAIAPVHLPDVCAP